MRRRLCMRLWPIKPYFLLGILGGDGAPDAASRRRAAAGICSGSSLEPRNTCSSSWRPVRVRCFSSVLKNIDYGLGIYGTLGLLSGGHVHVHAHVHVHVEGLPVLPANVSLFREQRAHLRLRGTQMDESQRTPSPSATCASENSISKRAISATP